MRLEEIKEEWNKGIIRMKKAEKLAEEDPEKFEKYIKSFHELTRELSYLMKQYKINTGKEMPDYEFDF